MSARVRAYLLDAHAKLGFVSGASGLASEWDEAEHRLLRAVCDGMIAEVDARFRRS